jgi:hypothetical protein
VSASTRGVNVETEGLDVSLVEFGRQVLFQGSDFLGVPGEKPWLGQMLAGRLFMEDHSGG